MEYTADFETTTNSDDCRVWAWAVCEIGGEFPTVIGTDIGSFLVYCSSLENPVMWFHNLAFDGEFIINYLLHEGWEWVKDKPGPRQFSTLISGVGKYYQVQLCFSVKGKSRRIVTFKDSLKKLTMSVAEVARAFHLPVQKLEIDYGAERPRGHILTDDEKKYITADVEIMARALAQQFSQGLVKLTAGADALSIYKETIGKKSWERLFPVIPVEMDAVIRKAYRGGWTYANPKFQVTGKKPKRNIWCGSVYDKNSMYPSVMYDQPLPVGMPVYFRGRYEFDARHPLYIQYFSCTAKLKKDRLPTLQIKNNPYFSEHEYVTQTDGIVDLAMTNIDMELFFDHYDVTVTDWLGGYMFRAMRGMFCEYVDYWMKIKETSTGGLRVMAKLMLNSLYGKFATNPDVTGKVPYLKEDGSCGYRLGEDETRQPVYTPMGVFITAYARKDIITQCQKIYPRFLYADTDSIHCLGWEPLDLDNVHPTRLGAWKHESDFDLGRYLRSKTYMERVVAEGKMVEGEYRMVPVKPYNDVKACGCPKNVRDAIDFGNFAVGLSLPGKLVPSHVPGGIVLVDRNFTIK